jgi:hypothetical protein
VGSETAVPRLLPPASVLWRSWGAGDGGDCKRLMSDKTRLSDVRRRLRQRCGLDADYEPLELGDGRWPWRGIAAGNPQACRRATSPAAWWLAIDPQQGHPVDQRSAASSRLARDRIDDGYLIPVAGYNMVRPSRKGSHSTMPRHIVLPEYFGGPSSG